MNLNEVIQAAKHQITVSRVFGEPYERDGVTVVPVACVYGGGGTGEDGTQHGEGGGIGFVARPAGVYVIRGGDVSWRPAVDANRLVTAVAVVLVVGALAGPCRGEALRAEHLRGGLATSTPVVDHDTVVVCAGPGTPRRRSSSLRARSRVPAAGSDPATSTGELRRRRLSPLRSRSRRAPRRARRASAR